MNRSRFRTMWVTPTIIFLFAISSPTLGQWSNPNGNVRPIRNTMDQWSNPNGNVRPIRNTAVNCGNCPAGYQREQGAYGMCGGCIPENKSCAPGNVLVGNQCNPCPCPGTSTGRSFGTSCRVDVDGQITCDCVEGYSGRDCSQCAPGAVQSNQYPYNCVLVNSTSSQSTYCPPGNPCPVIQIPQVVANPVILPPPQVTCPNNNCYPTQPCPVPVPRPNPWPQPQPQPAPNPYPCPVPGIPGPGPILCSTPPQCPINPPSQPCPTPCPVPIGPCPVSAPIPCPIPCPAPIPNVPCPIPCPAPIPNVPCPIPCPAPIPNVPCPIPCPAPIPNVPCPIPCPAPIPNVPCPIPCPAPIPNVPCPMPCPINPVPCPQPPTQCPDPCQRCPDVNCPTCPSCPNCPQTPPCYPCPNPCPPCEGRDCNVSCPSPCKDCPQCPNCSLNVTCPGLTKEELPCVCDERGTISQYGETCFCKANVGGQRCNTCKPGYFALAESRRDGCLQCWGSGVSSYCVAAVFFRNWIYSSLSSDCSIELTDESNTIVYSQGSNNKYTWDGKEARLSLTVSTRLFWSLPSCFKGNRLTSYGGILRFTRMFTGSGGNFGADNDVIIVGGNGARLYFSSFQTQSNGGWEKMEVVLNETTHMIFYKNGNSRPATRFDILEVLADVHLILIRATFTATTLSTSIRDVSLGTVSKTYTQFGFVLVIEQARCPTGYQGLSCESCAEGYFRDSTDMTTSVFGACKLCPCGRNALGCHVSYGVTHCQCKPGFFGDRCQDKEVITITLDPFWVRDCVGTEIDFTCTYTTNSKRTLLMRLGLESEPVSSPNQVTSVSRTYTLSSTLGRVKCEIVDQGGMTWALVYAAIKIEPCEMIIVAPPKTITIDTEEFICVDEDAEVEMKAAVYYYGSIQVQPQWFKEGRNDPIWSGPKYTIYKAKIADGGTYIVSALQGDTMDVKHVTLVVRPKPSKSIQNNDDPSVLMIDADTKKFNNSTTAESKPKFIPPQKSRPLFLNSMQKDQAIDGYPSIIVEPTEISAKVGETVTLRCNASGEEPMKFYWKSGSSDYIPVHVRVSRGALIFKSVKKEDAGSYYCVAWNHLGQVTAKAVIVVDDVPAPAPVPPLTVFVSKTRSEVAEGLNAYFECSTNNPNVRPMWSRKNGELPKNSEVTKNGTLIIYRVRESEAGVYICKAMGPGGDLVEVEATLGFIPVITSTIPILSLNPKSPVKGRSGEQVRIECSASGYPAPNISWSRSLDGSEKQLVSSQGNMTVYVIDHLTKADEGKYTCTATNVVGTKSESLSLVVDDVILCKANEFRCKSGDQCVPKEDRCDSERDCKDGSDEHHCRKRSA